MIGASWRGGAAVVLTVPREAVEGGAYAASVVLDRDQAFELLDALRRTLAADTPQGKAARPCDCPSAGHFKQCAAVRAAVSAPMPSVDGDSDE